MKLSRARSWVSRITPFEIMGVPNYRPNYPSIFKVGNQPINASVKAYYNVKDTSAAGDWAIVAQWAFLFPKGK
jgi:hypothetical protein